MPAVAAWHHYWHGLTAAVVLECQFEVLAGGQWRHFEVLADSLDAPTVTTDERRASARHAFRAVQLVCPWPPGVQLTPASSKVALVQSESSVGGQSS